MQGRAGRVLCVIPVDGVSGKQHVSSLSAGRVESASEQMAAIRPARNGTPGRYRMRSRCLIVIL